MRPCSRQPHACEVRAAYSISAAVWLASILPKPGADSHHAWYVLVQSGILDHNCAGFGVTQHTDDVPAMSCEARSHILQILELQPAWAFKTCCISCEANAKPGLLVLVGSMKSWQELTAVPTCIGPTLQEAWPTAPGPNVYTC